MLNIYIHIYLCVLYITKSIGICTIKLNYLLNLYVAKKKNCIPKQAIGIDKNKSYIPNWKLNFHGLSWAWTDVRINGVARIDQIY